MDKTYLMVCEAINEYEEAAIQEDNMDEGFGSGVDVKQLAANRIKAMQGTKFVPKVYGASTKIKKPGIIL